MLQISGRREIDRMWWGNLESYNFENHFISKLNATNTQLIYVKIKKDIFGTPSVVPPSELLEVSKHVKNKDKSLSTQYECGGIFINLVAGGF
jgi:hypothetical protein